MALNETSWVDAMHEELNQFEKLKVWQLVKLSKEKKSLDTRWVFRNKQDDSGVIVRNKDRVVCDPDLLDDSGVNSPITSTSWTRLYMVSIRPLEPGMRP